MIVTALPPSRMGDTSIGSVKRTKIALFGTFGIQNIGNECTLQAMLDNVRLRLPDVDVYGVCYEPEDTQRLHQLRAISVRCPMLSGHRPPARNKLVRLFRGVFRRIPLEIYDWFRVVWALHDTDLMIMTGTGMLTDFFCGSFGCPYDIFKWSLASKLARCKIRFVGVGVGPIYGRLSQVFIKAALGLADYRGFRDEQSKSRIKKFGFKRANDAVFPDLAFSLPASALPSPTKQPGARPVVGLGVMKFVDIHNQTDYEDLYDTYIETMCDFAMWLLEHGYAVRVLEGDLRHDRPVRVDLENRMAKRGITYGIADILAPKFGSPQDLVDQISQVDFVVSPRFHNLVFGIMLGKPVISLSYDSKNDALLDGCGLGEYRQSIERVDLNLLIEQFISLRSRAAGLRIQMQRKADEYRCLLQEQYATVLGDLERNPPPLRQTNA